MGQSLTDLMFKIKDAGVGDLSSERKGFLAGLFGGVQKFIAKYEKVETQIDKIVDQLDSSRMNLLRDIAILDQLFSKNKEYLSDLDIFLAAGQMKLEELKAKDLPALQDKAKASRTPSTPRGSTTWAPSSTASRRSSTTSSSRGSSRSRPRPRSD